MAVSDLDKYVIKQVKKRRLEKGWSQSQLAFETDLSNGFIGQVEGGKYDKKYSLAQLGQIAKALGCTLWDLIPENPK